MIRRARNASMRRLSLLLVVLGLLMGPAGLSAAASLCGSACGAAAPCDMAMAAHGCCCGVSQAPSSAALRGESSTPSFHLALVVRGLLATVAVPVRPSRLPLPVVTPVCVVVTGTGAGRAPPFSSASLS